MLVNLRKQRQNQKQHSEHANNNNNSLIQNLRVNVPSELKSYFTSRQEQDDCSICPSIEKEVQELPETYIDNHCEMPVEELILQSRLKDRALEKASSMIKLLEEENEELLSQVGYLETLLKDRDRQLEGLEEELKQAKPNESCLIKDLLNERENASSKQQIPSTINITTDFYTFAQQKDRQSCIRKSQSKIVNIDHPSFKEMSYDINVSKKLTPYASRHHIETDSLNISKMLANISVVLVQEGVGNSRVAMEEINELIAAEEQEQEQMMLEFELLEQEMDLECELPHSPESSKVSRQLFTLENKQAPQESLPELIERYQRCIQSYKEYAAYLRAHLCECINFLSQQQFTPRPFQTSWLSNFLRLTAREVGKPLKKRVKQLQDENWELKRIMEELIRNFEMAQQSSVRKQSD